MIENTASIIKPFQKNIYVIILLIALIWCAGILTAPEWAGAPGIRGDISNFMYIFYSKSCHQLDYRSFHIAGHKLGVCSRCTVIYFGFLLATIIYPFLKKLNNIELPSVWILLAGAALVALDAGLDDFNIMQNSYLSRGITGGVLGLILPFFIIPGTIRLFDEFFTGQQTIPKKN